MNWRFRHWIGRFVPALLFGQVLLMDLGVMESVCIPGTTVPVRELLLFLAVVLMVWSALQLRWFHEQTIIQKIRCLILAVFGLWLSMRFVPIQSTGFRDGAGAYFTSASFAELSPYAGLASCIVVLLCVLIFVCLRELIYIQQTKRTEGYFQTLRILLFFFIFVALTDFLPKQTLEGLFGKISIQEAGRRLMIVLIGFQAFLNGFRCKWIHYLNKPQKAVTFFAFVIVFGALVELFLVRIPRLTIPSLALHAFLEGVVFISVAYTGMSCLGILLILPSAGLMDRRIAEIKSLQALSATIGSTFEMDDLIAKTTKLAMNVVDADWSWMEFKENSVYRLVGTHGIRSEEIEQIPDGIRSEIRRQVKENDQALLLNDLVRSKTTKAFKQWHRRAGSILASSIEFKNQKVGILYAMKTSRFGFSDENRGLFRAFADQVGVAIENVNLLKVTIEQQVFKEELRLAHDAQMRLLPTEMPSVEGCELHAFCMTANEIGGDFYDIIQVNEERFDIVIGDVSGKGASAAFYMAELKGVIQALAPHFTSPKKILVEINTFLLNHFESDTFATMVYSILFPRKKQMRMVRAGHPPVGLVRKDSVMWIESDGLGLGLASDSVLTKTLKEQTATLKKGDTLFYYTDGLVEARNAKGEEYGEEALEKTLLELKNRSAPEMLDEIRSRLKTFTRCVPMHDDMTLVALRVLD